MNCSMRKRIPVIILAFLMLFSCCATMAEQAVVMRKSAVYASADSSAEKLGSLSAGTSLELVAVQGDWAMVKMDGNVGFMKSEAVAEVIDCKGMTAYAAKSAPMYERFDVESKKLGTIPAGDSVVVGAVAGEWAYVKYGKAIGFVELSRLTTEEPETASDPEDEALNIRAYASKDSAKVYNSKGKVIGTVDLNTEVTVKAVCDGICFVERSGATAYMLQSELSTEKTVVETEPDESADDDGVTKVSPTTVYIKNDGAKVYNANGKAIGTLSKDTKLTMTAYNDTLALVSSGSESGLMYLSDLTDKSSASASTSATLSYGDSGEAVKKVQSRLNELGYFHGNIGGNYLDLTQAAVKAFQTTAGLTASGVVDMETLTALFADDAPEAKVEVSTPTGGSSGSSSNSNGSSATPAIGTAVTMDWWESDIRSIFSNGTIATITDVDTGIAWNEKRTGGTNHADVQPVTAADSAAMKLAAGGWSWKRRAIFVTINGINYAASMNCMPHGSGSISGNNFDGHHCIHFTNSRTHGSNKVCSLHQAAIRKAANATL